MTSSHRFGIPKQKNFMFFSGFVVSETSFLSTSHSQEWRIESQSDPQPSLSEFVMWHMNSEICSTPLRNWKVIQLLNPSGMYQTKQIKNTRQKRPPCHFGPPRSIFTNALKKPTMNCELWSAEGRWGQRMPKAQSLSSNKNLKNKRMNVPSKGTNCKRIFFLLPTTNFQGICYIP